MTEKPVWVVDEQEKQRKGLIMPQIYHCPHCQQGLTVHDSYLNTQIVCPSCHQQFFAATTPPPLPGMPPFPPPEINLNSNFSPANPHQSASSSGKRAGSNLGLVIGMLAIVGLFGAGTVGYLMVSAEVKTPEPPPPPPPPPDPRKELEALIASSKSDEATLRRQIKEANSELETLRNETQVKKNEADAIQQEVLTLSGETK